ncbi:resuscitation-promoting factor protein RpfC [Streptomyces vastus]|uniref:Resuscitation-promoting factor protein RpfC n=1 Tax=Streptomyces vastus TaxID=285451 RepID=A0ABP6E0X5_9ACTN
MLSGNGRHRRPRQAPALFVAAGVTGSAIAIPLLAASGASAASGATWDAVAECESGGSWSANSGNGEYGGLQVTQEEWEQYGGLDYAMRADLASRSQQIAVAEKILADKGTSPWATCGLVAGLTQNSGSADVDTGLAQDSPTPTPTSPTEADSGSGSDSGQTSSDDPVKGDSSGSSDSSDTSADSGSSGTSGSSTGTSQDSGGDSTAESPSPDSSPSPPTGATNEGDSGNSGQNADSSSGESESTNTDEGTGRHRGGGAEEDADASRTDDSGGRHASRAGGGSRDAAGVADGSYTVRSGDSLSAIADSLGLQGGWPELYSANKRTVGADPDLILPGQRLELGTD